MTDKQWDDLVEPARAALEALITSGDNMTDRIEELEAKLAKAMEALREIKGQTTHCCGAEVAIIARIDKKEG